MINFNLCANFFCSEPTRPSETFSGLTPSPRWKIRMFLSMQTGPATEGACPRHPTRPSWIGLLSRDQMMFAIVYNV